MRSRFVLASEELATLFVPEGHQGDINDYFSSSSQPIVGEKESEESTVIPQSSPFPAEKDSNHQMLVLEQQTPTDHLIEEERAAKLGRKKSSNSKTAEQYQTTLF